MEKWLSFGGITTITNELGPRIGPHFARLNGELLCTEKGEREGRWSIVLLTKGIYALARKQETLCFF